MHTWYMQIEAMSNLLNYKYINAININKINKQGEIAFDVRSGIGVTAAPRGNEIIKTLCLFITQKYYSSVLALFLCIFYDFWFKFLMKKVPTNKYTATAVTSFIELNCKDLYHTI